MRRQNNFQARPIPFLWRKSGTYTPDTPVKADSTTVKADSTTVKASAS